MIARYACNPKLPLRGKKIWNPKQYNVLYSILNQAHVICIYRFLCINWIITFKFQFQNPLHFKRNACVEFWKKNWIYTISVRTCLNCDYRKWQFYTFKRFTTSSRRRRRRTVAEFKSHFSFTCFLRIASWLLIKFMVLKWILIKHAHQLASELVVSL